MSSPFISINVDGSLVVDPPRLERGSLQAALSRIWEHFVVDQCPPSINAADVCEYRGEDGSCCAIGVLLADNDYHPEMEGKSAGDLADSHPFAYARACAGIPPGLANELQACHDDAAIESRENQASDTFHILVESNLRMFAYEQGLEIPEGESGE